jgi:hypothetical protein
VLTNQPALTFNLANDVTVIPVLLAEVSGNQSYASGSPASDGNPVWQGVRVPTASGSGLTLLGRLSQYPAGEGYGDSPDGGLQIERSVIIGNYLYIVSQSEVMVTGLSSLVSLPRLLCLEAPAGWLAIYYRAGGRDF